MKGITEKNGFSPYRFETNHREKAYAEKWAEYNLAGHMLEYLLSPTNKRGDSTMTERDQFVANALIQWLGSPCGIYFVNSVLDDLTDKGE